MTPKLSSLVTLWIYGVKTASHNRDFDLETTLGPSGSDLIWCKNEETVLEALRPRCPIRLLTSLSLFYKWCCRCWSVATQRQTAGKHSSAVAGSCRLGPVHCVGTAVAIDSFAFLSRQEPDRVQTCCADKWFDKWGTRRGCWWMGKGPTLPLGIL